MTSEPKALDPNLATSPMAAALEAAREAAEMGEVPVGAVVVEAETGKVLAVAHNRVEVDAIQRPMPRSWR